MMKKKWFYYVLVCMMLVLVGCSSAADENTETASETQAAAENQVKETEKKEETDPVSLNVENDTFTFDALIQLIGADEKSALTLFGTDEKADNYKTELFGENVVITLSTESEKISVIQLNFAKTDAKLLTNAISEQLGDDGVSEKKSVNWELENCKVVLQQGKNECSVKISK